MALAMGLWSLLTGELAPPSAVHSPAAIAGLQVAARLTLFAWVVAGLFFLWKATHRLTRRREARPDDPLGIGPSAGALAITMADCAVLLALACIGALSRWHEAGPHAVHFALTAGMLWAMSVAPEEPRRAGLWIGALLALGVLNEGLKFLLAGGLGLGMVCLLVGPWRMVHRTLLGSSLITLLSIFGTWLMLVVLADQHQALHTWWELQTRFIFRPLLHGPETWAWSWWPLWPVLAALAVQAWRHGLWRLVHLQMVALLLFPWLLVYMLGFGEANPARLVPVALLACLTAYGLLSLPRSVSSLVDWFAVVAFTSLGLLIWLYWSAIQFGFPEKLAARLDFLAPGVTGNAGLLQLLAGLCVSGAWLALVAWRIGRGESRLWRPVVLSAGGLTLTWVLMMNLLLPALEINRGYQSAVGKIQQAIDQSLPSAGLSSAQRCVQAPGSDLTSRAVILSSIQIPLARPSYGQCFWRLSTSAYVPEGWSTILVSPRNPNRPERTKFHLQVRTLSE
jgi:4-amino-4-deoxy-L-arabinose transferase-like glycosyltransferase